MSGQSVGGPKEMEILRGDDAGLRRAVDLLRLGEVVAIPTESTYGLAADALNPDAVARLVDIKGRAEKQPISVMVADQDMAGRVAVPWSPAAQSAMQRHWPGPLTIVLKAIDGLASPLLNSRGGIGVRVSSDTVVAQLLDLLGRPITATSANRSGTAAATRAAEVDLDGLAAIVDDGPRQAEPSTVVDMMDGVQILRQGAIVL